MKKKTDKEKPLYSTRQNVVFTISNMWKWDKLLVFISIAQAPLNVVLQLSGLYIVRLVISLIENDSDVITFGFQIIIFSVAVLSINIINNIVAAKIQWRQFKIRFKYMNLVNFKNMDTDYENIENPDGMNKMEKAFQTVNSNNSATQNIINIMINAATSIISMLSLSAIITMFNPLLLFAIISLTLIQHFINRAGHRWHHKNTDKWAPIDRKLNHINHVSGDFNRAKDIRLYSLKSWLLDVFSDALGKRVNWYKKAEKASFGYYDINQAITQFILCNGITFVYIINGVSNGAITIADAVFYMWAIGTLSGVIMGVVNSMSELNTASLAICRLRDFLDMPDKTNRGKGVALPAEAVEIEFDNVTFKYPKSEKSVIDSISFKIQKGEKVAIVGRNGVGKTTLVKLLCGLYRPLDGKIKINGNEIPEYNRDDYYTLISAVFQDIYLYPVSFAQNIALIEENNVDNDKLTRIIALAGLRGKIDSLPDGKDTFILKSVVDNAIELSGGEKQKLSLARALYKDGLMLVLDEPTAALDPIAENEMYMKYSKFSEGKTSIFISHRLSSTRFCDRIFFIYDGQIIETGSHDELMAQNGKYAEIFNIQSYYYKEGAVNEGV